MPPPEMQPSEVDEGEVLRSVGIAPLIGFQGGLMGVGAAVEGTLLSFALADGIRRLRAERRAARRKAEHAQRDMLEAQLSAQKQKGAFLSMMSHELRTPLSQVLGITQLLELTEEDDDRREQLILVRRGGTDLLTMIDDMLLFTARTVHRSQPIAGGARTALVGRFLLDAPRFRGVSLDTRTVQRKNLCNHGLRSGDPVNSSCFPQLYPWVPPMHRYRRRTRRTRVPSAWSWLWANLWWSVAA